MNTRIKLPFNGCLAAALSIALAAHASPEPGTGGVDFTSLSLEELLQVEITSLGKKSQRLADVAAAVHVISREDILRSGATTLPEALRLAPGVDAAHMGGGRWSVSIRGFSGRWANKLLVLVDGRSIYTPLYAGVEWEQENIPLELIERIEVIRGPAASTWGANAVSGVINIITRTAADTRGSEIRLHAGTEDSFSATVMHGLQLDDDTHLRFFATGNERRDDALSSGKDAYTASERSRGGFRMDKALNASDFTLIGEAYYLEQRNTNLAGNVMGPPYSFPVNIDSRNNGAFLMGRWTGRNEAGRESSLQAVLEHVYNDNTLGWSMRRNTLDLDWHTLSQHHGNHELTWGVNYRVARDEMGDPTLTIAYAPLERTMRTFSLYAQDDTAFDEGRWLLSLGARLENNSFTQWEFQPNARLLRHVTPESSAWVSVARAVRTPSRTETDVRLDFLDVVAPSTPPYYGTLPVAVTLAGDPDLESEDLTALEIGYRTQWSPRLSLDAAAFVHHYRHLRNSVWNPPLLYVPLLPYQPAYNQVSNLVEAKVYGLEATADWRVTDGWRLSAAYSHARLVLDDDDLDRIEDYEGSLPRHIVSLRSSHDLGRHMELDFWLRHVSKRDATQVPARRVPAYTTLDVRLAWKPRKDLTLSLVGQNLLDDHHLEYVQEIFATVPAEIRRSVGAEVAWRF